MSAESQPDLQLEIAHLLLIDVVGYSKLLVNEQIELLQELNRVVRASECFRAAEAAGKLIRLPTGDGMALLFFNNPEQPVRCAMDITKALQNSPNIKLRMGIHSGPVNQVRDVNDSVNVAGAGINVAQRVLDCGDAGHILLSKHLADDLAHYRHWQPYLHDIGECEAKHGLRLHVVSLYKDGIGNPAMPEKFRRRQRWRSQPSVRPITAPRWPKWALIVALILSIGALVVSSAIFFRWPTFRRGVVESALNLPILEKSIAVLPFDNFSDDKGNAHLISGVHDEILTDLSKVADLKVISRTSVMQYKSGSPRNLREIGRQLGVAHIVEGSIQRVANRIRVTAQLIDARTDAHLWAEHYDRDLEDVFALESELSEKIVAQLKSKLSPEEKAAIEEKPTADLVAYDGYVRAKNLIARAVFDEPRQEKLREAITLLERATARDASFALAYYQLAHAHDQMFFVGFDHTSERLKLAEAALAALQKLRPESGETHLGLAKHLYWGYLDYDRARAELDIARRILPNDATAVLLTGYIDRRQGRWDESTRNLERAVELDPRNISFLQQLALSYECLRRYDSAAAVLDRALTVSSKDAATRLQRAGLEFDWKADTKPLRLTIDSLLKEDSSAAVMIGDRRLFVAFCERDSEGAARAFAAMTPNACAEQDLPFPRAWCEGLVERLRGNAAGARAAFTRARADMETVVRAQPNYAPNFAVLAVIDATLGRKEDSIREGKRAVELLPIDKDAVDGAPLVQYLAVVYASVGRNDLALDQLEALIKLPGYLSYGQLRLNPQWDPLRHEPRFQKILAALAPK